jgi:biopolymer transport protein ExbD
MAFSTQGNSGYGRRRGGMPGMAEINIIPLVDVVLVLLIIFMLTAHVMEFGLEVEVPKVKSSRDSSKELPVVSMTATGEVHLNDKIVNINALGESLRAQFPKQTAVYVRADKETKWDALAQVVDQLGREKFAVNMVTQPDDGK